MKYLVINIDEKLSAIFTVGILTVAKSMQQTISPDRRGLCLTKECRLKSHQGRHRMTAYAMTGVKRATKTELRTMAELSRSS